MLVSTAKRACLDDSLNQASQLTSQAACNLASDPSTAIHDIAKALIQLRYVLREVVRLMHESESYDEQTLETLERCS